MSSDLLAVARSYVAAGLSVIPVKGDGTKAPDGRVLPEDWDETEGREKPTWKPYQTRLPSDDELRAWFEHPPPDRGIAVVAGAVSGNLAVFDFESQAAFDEWCGVVGSFGLGAVNGDPMVSTPRGGVHLYLHTPTPLPTQKLAKTPQGETKIELKAEGGYVLAPGCPPACHPTGREYSWVRRGWLS